MYDYFFLNYFLCMFCFIVESLFETVERCSFTCIYNTKHVFL
jgi:hypothetical protein